jgi:hypothetical protein
MRLKVSTRAVASAGLMFKGQPDYDRVYTQLQRLRSKN